MRRLLRLRWLLPAVGILVCVVALSFAVQVAAFRRPASERLVAASVLRELMRYRVMRGIEKVGRHSVATTCLDGWFRVVPGKRPLHGAFVVLAGGEKLFDFGYGVRRAGHAGPVGPLDRVRFELAGCPLYLGKSIIAKLLHDLPLDADRVPTSGTQDLVVVLGPDKRPIKLVVNARSLDPVKLVLSGPLGGTSRLAPGASQGTITRMEHAFELTRRTRPPRV